MDTDSARAHRLHAVDRRALVRLVVALTFTIGTVAAVAPPAEAIVGGRNATQEYPFMAAFRENGRQICGASLIAPDWVLTAAHCVDTTNPAPYSFTVGGRPDLNQAGGETIPAAEVVVHPSYASTGVHDVALMRLQRPAPFEPIALADPVEDRDLWEPEDPARVIGYGGQAFPGLLADGRLREVDVPVVDDADCDFSYGLTFGGIDENTEVCAGELHGTKDSCQGDSGGPLFVRNDAGAPRQIGVVSWGFGCGWPTQYGVYSRVGDRTLYDWVHEKISGSDPVEPPPPPPTKTVAVDPEGYIAGAAPLPQEGITATELELSCTTDLASQGVDGYAWELPEELAVPGAVAQVTGDALTGHDLDIAFYGVVDGACRRLGWAGTSAADEKAPVPAGTQFVLAHAWFASDTVVDLTVEVPDEITSTNLELSDTNPVEGRFNEEVTFSATLTDGAGAPLEGRPVRFALMNEDDETIQFAPGSTTDENGVSELTMRLGVPAGEYTLKATFIGQPGELQEAKAEAPFTALLGNSALSIEASGNGNNRQVTVALTDAESESPIAGRPVEVFADCEHIGRVETGEDGTATLPLSGRNRAPKVTFSAVFEGDQGSERYYGGTSDGPEC